MSKKSVLQKQLEKAQLDNDYLGQLKIGDKLRREKTDFDLMDQREERAFQKIEKLAKEKKSDQLGEILKSFAGGKDIIKMLDD